MDLVEPLGSGVPIILQSYGPERGCFSENFTRMSFPMDEEVEHDKEIIDVGVKTLLVFIENNPGTNVITMVIEFNVTQRIIER